MELITNRIIIILKCAIIVIIITNILYEESYSQADSSGRWSLLINGNYNGNFGTSEAMKGNATDFINEVSLDYNNKSFPFGENATKTGNLGFQLSYREENSPISYYIAANYYFFYLEWQYLFYTDYTLLNIFSISPGIEYNIGELTQIWNLFGRAGINFNSIWGKVDYLSHSTFVNYALRIGVECEFGGRLNIPSTPISLELSAQFSNMNLFGKSYTKINKIPPQSLNERELNDGKNPDNPNDINRNISFITLKGGLRIWF